MNTTSVELALCQVLDDFEPVDVRDEIACRRRRAEHAIVFAVSEAKLAQLDQLSVWRTLLRLLK